MKTQNNEGTQARETYDYIENIPIVKAKDNFGSEYLYIATSKRKAWNMLLKDGGIVCLNKQYIKHKGLIWHNNSLIPSLICTDGFKEVIAHTDLLQGEQ